MNCCCVGCGGEGERERMGSTIRRCRQTLIGFPKRMHVAPLTCTRLEPLRKKPRWQYTHVCFENISHNKLHTYTSVATKRGLRGLFIPLFDLRRTKSPSGRKDVGKGKTERRRRLPLTFLRDGVFLPPLLFLRAWV